MHHLDIRGGGRMPALGLGTWKSDPGVVGEAVREALRIGYRHIDCAPIYGNEAEIGEAFSAAFADGDVKREELWVTSKLWNHSHRNDDVLPALKQTLADLRLDYLDLFLIHWPVAHQPGVTFPETPDQFMSLDDVPLAETWAAMEEAVDQGLARHIGVSNFRPGKIDEVLGRARIKPAVDQVECHPYLAQNELLAYLREHGTVLTAYSPLGSPDRPDRLRKDEEPKPFEEPVTRSIADRLGATPAQVLIAWALHRGTSVIPKSANADRLRQNFEAQHIRLSDEDMATLNGLDRGYRFIDGSFWTPEGSPYTLADLWGT